MALVEPLIEIAKANGCTDLEACRKVVRSAAEEQRSLIQSILDSRLVDETGFLKGVSRWLEIPWWNEPITGIPAPLREKVPARTALRYRVVPLREEGRDIWIAFYDPFDLLARQTLADVKSAYSICDVDAYSDRPCVAPRVWSRCGDFRSDPRRSRGRRPRVRSQAGDERSGSRGFRSVGRQIRKPDPSGSARSARNGYSRRTAAGRSTDSIPD